MSEPTYQALRVLEGVKGVHSIPDDDVVESVMLPAFRASTSVRCMVGFFDSSSFKYLAPGLAAFINETDGELQLLVSPRIDARDQEALRLAVEQPKQVMERAATTLFGEARISEAALARHNYDCLAYLLVAGRLDMKVVLMKDGLFHPKVWIFDDGTDLVVVHGSGNMTAPGLLWNYEEVTLERPWRGEDPAEKADRFVSLFTEMWSGQHQRSVVIGVPEAVKLDLLEHAGSLRPPTVTDFWRAWRDDAGRGSAPPLPSGHEAPPFAPAAPILRIPDYVNYESGPFGHQGEAVRAWEKVGRRGILAMATGSGKTIAALVGAARLQEESERLLVVIAAPYRPLIIQWEEEVRAFGVEPVRLARAQGEERLRRVQGAIQALRVGASTVECLVVTHNLLTDSRFHEALDKVPSTVTSLLIADEVHNLGRASFVRDPPEQFSFRLGLSATPQRQYDPQGTSALLRYMGEPVYEYSLRTAIGNCLVPYSYHLHPVNLAEEEFAEWLELTDKLHAIGFSGDEADPSESGVLSPEITRLLVKRRRVIETAESKVEALEVVLRSHQSRDIRHTLIYTSDKGAQQIRDVNRLVGRELGLLFHQLTQQETSRAGQAAEILESFASGELQVLTCKRVLDEGVNIPQVATAYLLASSTVRRQWIQRRGRILRLCKEIGKQAAVLHDFLVVPPAGGPRSGKSILRQELLRARHFAELSTNAGDPRGPYDVMRRYVGVVDGS